MNDMFGPVDDMKFDPVIFAARLYGGQDSQAPSPETVGVLFTPQLLQFVTAAAMRLKSLNKMDEYDASFNLFRIFALSIDDPVDPERDILIRTVEDDFDESEAIDYLDNADIVRRFAYPGPNRYDPAVYRPQIPEAFTDQALDARRYHLMEEFEEAFPGPRAPSVEVATIELFVRPPHADPIFDRPHAIPNYGKIVFFRIDILANSGVHLHTDPLPIGRLLELAEASKEEPAVGEPVAVEEDKNEEPEEGEETGPSIFEMSMDEALGTRKAYSDKFGRHSWRCPVPNCEAGHVSPIRNGKGAYTSNHGVREQDGDHVVWFRQGLVCPEHGAFIQATFSGVAGGIPSLGTAWTEPSKSDLSGGSALSCDDIIDRKLKEELEEIDSGSLDDLDDCEDLDQFEVWADEHCHGGASGFKPSHAPNPFGNLSAIEMMARMAVAEVDLSELDDPHADRGDVARCLMVSIEKGEFGEEAIDEWRDYIREGFEESREDRQPAGISYDYIVTITIAGGGPSIEYELLWSGDWAGGWYIYKDWFDGARRWIPADTAESVANQYGVLSPEDMGYPGLN